MVQGIQEFMITSTNLLKTKKRSFPCPQAKRKHKLIKVALLLELHWQAFGVVHLQNPSLVPCQQKIITRFQILLVGALCSLFYFVCIRFYNFLGDCNSNSNSNIAIHLQYVYLHINVSVATEDAQTSARETGECDSGDDDNQDLTLRRSSNRKRRVVFDFSDEDEDAVNLASPELPKKQVSQDSRQNDNKSSEKATLNFDMKIENKSRAKEEKASDQKANQPFREEISVINKCTSTGKSSTEKLQSCAPEISVNKDSLNNAAPGSPKRRKVMKTRIDERGREGTYVLSALFSRSSFYIANLPCRIQANFLYEYNRLLWNFYF